MATGNFVKEMNEQVKYELFSANYYLAMAAYCADRDLDGFANFFIVQAEEERFHAMKFFHFLVELGERVTIAAMDEPKNAYKSLEEVFDLALKHEEFVTDRINTLMDLAVADKHYAAINFLQWFVTEQVEEESSMNNLLQKVKMVGEDGMGQYILDKELASRSFTPGE